MMKRYPLPLLLSSLVTLSLAQVYADDLPVYQGDEVVVTAVSTHEPLRIETDPRRPRQPVPAADGGGFLKTIPGMNVARKGGISGDPILRGLGGSRLAILSDGGYVLGGCGGRMDPPTAYLYPDSYDTVTVFKGPQTVLLGPGLIAGAVNFERKTRPFSERGVRTNDGILAGSYDRLDGYIDLTLGEPRGYLRMIGVRNHGGDYRDGAGDTLHSSFHRDSQTAIAGITPDINTIVEMTIDRSRGQAAFADRLMDGSKFDRDAWGIKAERRSLTPWLDALRIQYRHGYIDHVMDNYSMRPLANPANKAVGNPDRTYHTARISADLAIEKLHLTVGSDWQQDWHTRRMLRGVNANQYVNLPRIADQHFTTSGTFAEARWPISDSDKLIAGWRYDRTTAIYQLLPDNNPARQQNYPLNAAFVRYESYTGALTRFIGIGQSQRAPDFWERNYANAQTLDRETSYQLDTGVIYTRGPINTSLSLFANHIHHFILIDRTFNPAQARNINAQRFGFEADASWHFTPQWKIASTLAYVYADNQTDQRPLAQTMPLEGTVSLAWDNGKHAAALLLRGVQRQNRYAQGQGNVIGSDLGPTGGFGVISFNGGWIFNKHVTLTAGIDNIFNKNYAEPINKAGQPILGYAPIARVNEPGRTLWSKLQVQW